jgi:hypothetical protein
MKTISRLGMGLCFLSALGFGITMYRGQLMDASCYNQNREVTGQKIWVRCAPTASTTSFAIRANGSVRMLDDDGNAKAAAAFKEGILKRDKNGDMPVTIDGRRHGDTIKVEGISARGSNISVH